MNFYLDHLLSTKRELFFQAQDLPKKVKNILTRSSSGQTLGEFLRKKPEDFLQWKGVGKHTLHQVECFLNKFDFSFGLETPPSPIEKIVISERNRQVSERYRQKTMYDRWPDY